MLTREENRVQVLPSSLRVGSTAEARDRLEKGGCVRISHILKSTKRADVATKPKEEEEKTQSGAGVITSSDRLR